jgi:hypothetical protein
MNQQIPASSNETYQWNMKKESQANRRKLPFLLNKVS